MYNDHPCIMLAHFWTFSDPYTQWNLVQNFTGILIIILDSSISLHLIAFFHLMKNKFIERLLIKESYNI